MAKRRLDRITGKLVLHDHLAEDIPDILDYVGQPLATFTTAYPVSPVKGLYSFAGTDGAIISGTTYYNGDSAFYDGVSAWTRIPFQSLANYYLKTETDTKYETISKVFQINSNYPRLTHLWYDDSALARLSERTTTYSGTTYYVDASKADDTGNGLTPATAKKTITAAYNLAANGDILQLANGTYNIANEAGGYLLLNRAGIGVQIKSNASDKTAVKILQDSAATFAVRLRQAGEIQFKDLTIETNQANSLIHKDGNYSSHYHSFVNCKLKSTNDNAQAYIYKKSEASLDDSTAKQVDFINCEIERTASSGSVDFFSIETGGVNNVVIFKNCTVTLNYSVFAIYSTYKGKVAVYNSTFNHASNNLALQFGADTAIPTYSTIDVDFRNNVINYASGKGQHALLVGRGVTKCKILNNKVLQNAINDSLNLGIGVKSIAANEGDCVYYGNYVVSPRPLIFKGAKLNVVKYNSFVNNESNWSPVALTNYKSGADEALSQNNILTDNNIVTTSSHAILLYSGSASEAETVSAKTCTFDSNKYYLVSSYLKDESENLVAWGDKATFWGNDNDGDSTLLVSNNIPIKLL